MKKTRLKIFLGGTCNESTWRERLIRLLNPNIDYFNPVVDDWTPDHQAEELRQREICDVLLYVVTPKMTGVYSIAEAVDDSNKHPSKTMFAVLCRDIPSSELPGPAFPISKGLVFRPGERKSLDAVCSLIQRNGGVVFRPPATFFDIAKHLNSL